MEYEQPAESTECPFCGCKQSTVAETRDLKIRGHHIKMRIRSCRFCKRRFKTKEIVDQSLVQVNLRGKNKPKEFRNEEGHGPVFPPL